MGCRVRSKRISPPDTGSVSRYSRSENPTRAVAVAPTVQRHEISASVSEGRRKAARKPSSVGEMRDMRTQDNSWRGRIGSPRWAHHTGSSDHKVEQLPRDEDRLDDLLP